MRNGAEASLKRIPNSSTAAIAGHAMRISPPHFEKLNLYLRPHDLAIVELACEDLWGCMAARALPQTIEVVVAACMESPAVAERFRTLTLIQVLEDDGAPWQGLQVEVVVDALVVKWLATATGREDRDAVMSQFLGWIAADWDFIRTSLCLPPLQAQPRCLAEDQASRRAI